MLTYDAEASFIAHVKSQTSGFEGYWDRHTLGTYYDDQGQRQASRLVSDSLTINNFCNLPEHAADRYTFLFRCYVLASGASVYQILTTDDPDSPMELSVQRELGYLTFYAAGARPKYLWKLEAREVNQETERTGNFRGVTLDMLNDKGERWSWLGLRQKGGKLTPYGRKDEWKYWYCSVSADGYHNDPELISDIYIQRLGLHD